MKRILFITHYPGVGGANIAMLHLIDNLVKEHHVIPMVYLPMLGTITEQLEKYNIPYEIHRYMSWRTTDKGLLRNVLQALLMVIVNVCLSIRLLPQVSKYDLLYSNSSKVVLGAFLKFFTRKPLIWHLREFGTIDYPMIFLAPRKIVTKVLAYADVCIAISMEIEKVYRTQFSPHANYKLVYDGVELNNYQLKVAPQEGRAIKICMVGGFSESKNQKDLIQAIAKLNTSRSEFHVDFYGDHRTAYGEEMEALTRKYNLTSCISFKGQTNHINQLLPHYQIGVICSQYEAFGLVLVEYMLSNLAVIATDSGACPELVNDGRTGLIYHLGDSEDLAHKIQRLMDHPDLQSELSRNGRDYAAAHYTAEINARQIAEIIAGL